MASLVSFPDVLPPHDCHALDPAAEVRAVRAQAAVVRSLLDELEMLSAPQRLAEAVAAQTVEELTQLAWRMLQTAAAIAPHRVISMSHASQGTSPEGTEPERIAG